MLDLAERPAVASRPWLAHYDPGVPATLEYPAARLDELLRRTADRYPDRAALIFFGRQTSYRRLARAVDQVADGLRRLGLRRGDRVALCMPNCPQLVTSVYAVWHAGCIAVPINARATVPELSRQLADAGAAAAIVLDRLWLGLENMRVPPTLRLLVVADVADDLPLRLRIGARITRRGGGIEPFASGGPDVISFRTLVRQGEAAAAPGTVARGEAPAAPSPAGGREAAAAPGTVGRGEAPAAPSPAGGREAPAAPGTVGSGEAPAAPSPAGGREAPAAARPAGRGEAPAAPGPASLDDPAVLLYTGGTTGLPKAAVLTHRNLAANACQLGAWAAGLDDGAEVMLSALPLVHGYAMTASMNVAVLRGWTQVLVPDPRDVGQLLAGIARWRVTVFPGVPTLYAAICGHPTVVSGRRDLRTIEACISGAAPLPTGIQAEFERLTGGRLVEGYGLSEASPATHCNPLGSGGRSGSIGLPLPDTDCRLLDVETESRPVALGQAGVLCVSGPQVMAGYWQRPEETAQVLRRGDDGKVWLHTGDVAVMAEDGYFRIVDRKKDLIVAAGGLKVYPNEIEDVLSTHPKIRLAAVIGVPVGSPDQRAKAFVLLREGERADPDEILAFLRDRLAPYKVPKALEFRPELPLAFTGKVLRRVLADEERSAAAAGAP